MRAVFAGPRTERSGEYICPPIVPEKGNKLVQTETLAENLMTLKRRVVKMYAVSVEKRCPMESY